MSAFDDGRGISPVPPQQTPQNIDWEKEFDNTFGVFQSKTVVGEPMEDWSLAQNGERFRPSPSKVKSFIRSKKKEWQEEAVREALKSIVFMYSDDARRSDLARLLDDLQESIAYKIEHPEVVIPTLSRGETKEI